MASDPIAYGLFGLDRLRGKADADVLKRKTIFTERYLDPAKRLVGRLLNGQEQVDDGFICQVAGITKEELAQAREIDQNRNAPKGMMAMMMAAAGKTTGSHACEGRKRGTSDVRDDEEYDETERPGCEDWRNAGEQGDWRKPGYECHDEGDDGKEGQGIFQRSREVNKALAIIGSGTDVEKRE